jgi:hypothetical protein
MKLNPAKCAFGAASRKFLGFMVSQREIETNSMKINEVLEMLPLHNTRELQRLTERIATLNRFINEQTNFFNSLGCLGRPLNVPKNVMMLSRIEGVLKQSTAPQPDKRGGTFVSILGGFAIGF